MSTFACLLFLGAEMDIQQDFLYLLEYWRINKSHLELYQGLFGTIHLVCTQRFPEKLTFLIPWYAHVRVRIRG